jgi:hypothetical protein
MPTHTISYQATPTVARFMQSDAFVRLILGPVGSGKTTGIIFEMLRRSALQAPDEDGVRRTRWSIVRQTLEQMRQTILLDALQWLRPIATYKVSDKLIVIDTTPMGGDLYSEWFMIPLEDPEDQKRLLSSQLTGCAMNEFPEINPDLVGAIAGRCGRFPKAPTWFGIIGDGNFPTEGGDWHRLLELEPPPDWAVFKQPGGLDLYPDKPPVPSDLRNKPMAENLNWLTQTADTLKLPLDDPARLAQGRLYYERLSRTSNPDWVLRYVHAQYGPDPSGTAVWRGSFKRAFHVSDTSLLPIQGKPLIIGQDFGRSPCSLICQADHKGRLLVLEEIIAEDMGLELHVRTNLQPRLQDERYKGLTIACVGDPSGASKGSITEETNFDALKRMGIPAFPAPTNDLIPRLNAVEQLLLQQRDGGAALLIDGLRCPKLVLAMAQNYRYARAKQTGITKNLPDKNHPYSDLADDLQYVCLMVNSGMVEYVAKKIGARRSNKPRQARVPVEGWT